MKNKRYTKILAVLFSFILLAALFVGCAAPKAAAPEYDKAEGGYSTSEAAPMAPAAEAPMPAATAMPAEDQAASNGGIGKGTAQGASDEERKIIRTAWLTIETKNFMGDVSSIEQRITAIGGYVQSSFITGREPKEWNDPGRNATITARVPSDKLESFLSDIKAIGEVIEQNTGSDDVTMQYFDTESHVSVLKIQLERLKAILASSDKLADVLALETEIARIQYEIERLTTDLRRWDNLVSYSTVEIRLAEVTQLQKPQYTSTKLGDRIRDAFNRSISSTADFLEGLLVFLVALVPILPILAVIALIVWLIVRASKRAQRKNEAKRAAQKADTNPDKPDGGPDKPEKAFK